MINDHHLSDSVHHGFYDEKLMSLMVRLCDMCVMYVVMWLVNVIDMITMQIVEMFDV